MHMIIIKRLEHTFQNAIMRFHGRDPMALLLPRLPGDGEPLSVHWVIGLTQKTRE